MNHESNEQLVSRLRTWIGQGGGPLPRECFSADFIFDDGILRTEGEDAFAHLEQRAPFERTRVLVEATGPGDWIAMTEGMDPVTGFHHRAAWAFIFEAGEVITLWRVTSPGLPETPYGDALPLGPTQVRDPRRR